MERSSDKLAAKADTTRVESRFFAPPDDLAGCFTTFYRMDLQVPEGALLVDVMPPEWASLRFFCGATPDATVEGKRISGIRLAATGPCSFAAHFSIASTRMWGIGLLPLGWASFLDLDANEVANLPFDGEAHPDFAFLAPLARELCESEASEQEQYDAIVAAMRAAYRETPEKEKILKVHRALLDEQVLKVTDFAAKAETSVRSLERTCYRFFGFSPKVLLRRQRFMRSLAAFMLQEGRMWTSAMDAHYHDQAQFSREFTTFMGMTPRQYAAMEHPFLKSFIAARARMVGSPAQALDAPGL